MDKIAVTGATGLLGAHFLWQALQTHPGLVAICRNPHKQATVLNIFKQYDADKAQAAYDRIDWRVANLLEIDEVENALQGIELVFNLAAQVSFNPKDARKLVDYNAGITENVVNACLYLGIENLVHLSSVAALGRKEDKTANKGIDEDTYWENSRQNSVYAISKYRAEMEAWRGMVEGMKVLVLCPPIILAPGFRDQSSGKLYPTVAKGLPFYTYGENGFVDVRDLSKAMLQLVQAKKWNEKYIVSGVHSSYKNLFDLIAAKAGSKKPFIRLTSFLGGIFWRLEWLRSRITGRNPLLTKETFRSSQGKYHYLSDKLIDTLNFEFTPLQETIEWIGDWYALDNEK
jgi:dihydroflavonol-4-reductase